MSLMEVVIAMVILGTFLLGFLTTALQSRRTTESNVMASAATSLVYGIMEQIKMLDFESDTPYLGDTPDAPYQTLDAFPAGKPTPPYQGLGIRINQDQYTSLHCVYNTDNTTFTAPTTTPTSLSSPVLDPAMKNTIGPISLSSVVGTKSQPLTLYIWVWVDDISDTTKDIISAKCVTLVYAYQFNDGHGPRTIINREVIVRAPYAPLRKTNNS